MKSNEKKLYFRPEMKVVKLKHRSDMLLTPSQLPDDIIVGP